MQNYQDFADALYDFINQSDNQPSDIGAFAVDNYNKYARRYKKTLDMSKSSSKVLAICIDDIASIEESIRESKPPLFTHQTEVVYEYLGHLIISAEHMVLTEGGV